MPQPLSDDEFSNQFGGGFRAAPSPVGMSGRFGAAVDRTQASLLGIGEAAGLPLGGLRRENQAEADASMQRYYRETGAPRSFSDVSSAGDFGSYVAGLATDSVPAMAGIAAGGLAGGPMGALAAGTALGTGDVLDNQREQAGTTNLASAIPLGLAYGAADSMLGVGGMVARRSMGTGIRALDRAGVDMLDGLTGMKGVAARTGATALKTGAVESASETFQEGTNQLGRMSVDPTESFYNERSAENFKESAIGGGLLGGLMGGAAGGWTRSKGYQENEQRDLLAGQEKVQAEQAQTQQYGLQREQARAPVDAALAGFFPEVEQEAAAAQRRKAYMQQFGEAAGAPSGEFVASPEDGIESQLDMGQMFDQRVPPTPEEQIAKEASDASFKAEQEFLQRATTLGVPPKSTPGLKALRMLEDVQGEISPEDYGTLEGKLKAGQFGTVTDALNSREKAFANQAKAQEKAQADAVKAAQRETEKAQKEATKLAEKQAKDAAKEAERAAKAATPTPEQVVQANDTPAPPADPMASTLAKLQEQAPKPPVATETVAPKSPSIAKLRQKVAAEKAARVTAAAAVAPEVTVSEEKVGGVAVEKVAYVAPAKKAAVDEVATKDARASAALVETLLRGNRDEEGGTVAASYEAFKRRLSAVTGFYLDTDEDTGDTVLRQDRNPIPMTEVAAAEGVTRAAISKQLNQHGVSDEVVGALAGVESGITEDADTATVDGDGGNETGSDADTMETSDAAAEEIGGRVSTTAARATGAGQVTGEDFTPGARATIARAIAKAVELGGNAEAIQTVVAPMQKTIDQAVGVNATETEVEDSDGTTAEAEDTAYNGDGSVKAAKAAAAKEKKAATLEKKAGLLAEDVRQASRIKSAIIAGVAERMVVKEKPNSKDAPKTAQDLAMEAERAKRAEATVTREVAVWFQSNDNGRLAASWWDDRAKANNQPLFTTLAPETQFAWAKALSEVTETNLNDRTYDNIYSKLAGTQTSDSTGNIRQDAGARDESGRGAPDQTGTGRGVAAAPTVVKKRSVVVPPVGETQRTPAAPATKGKLGLKSTKVNADMAKADLPFNEDVVSLEVAVEAAPAQEAPTTAPGWATGHEPDVGGNVVYFDGETALLRASSVLSGQNVYVGVSKGGSRTRTDIRSYTGNLFTPEQLANLNVQRERIVAEDLAKHNANPDGPFSTIASGVSAGDSVTPALANTLRGWVTKIGMGDVRILLIHPADVANADALGLHGPFSSARSAGIDGNEHGATRAFPEGRGHYIVLDSKVSEEVQLETLAHELGHIVEKEMLARATPETKAAIEADYRTWLAKTKGMTARELTDHLRNRNVAESMTVPDMQADKLGSYWTSKKEWFADNVSRWATTSRVPVSVVDRFFKSIADKFRALVGALTGRKFAPSPAVAAFMDSLVAGRESLALASTVPTTEKDASASSMRAIKPSQLNDAALTFLEVVKSKGANGLVKMMLTSDLIASANTVLKGLPLKYKAAMDAITAEKTKEERSVADVVEEFSKLSKTAQGTGLMSVNKMLKDSTMAKAWAFEPDWLPKGSVKVDPILAKRFNDPEFSKEGRELVKKVFKHGHDSLKALQKAVVDNTNSEYDALIQELTKAGKMDEAKAETVKKAKSLSDFESLLSARSGWPYAPLRRFGKHVVMAVSARYRQAKDDGNVNLMRELESNGDHYFVAFAEGKREALNMLNQIKDSYPGGSSGTFEKLDRADSMMGGRDMLGAMRRLRRMAKESVEDKGLGEKTGDRVDDMMRQLYLTLLSETSARKGEIHRKNVAGANEDMMRSFSTQGVATAHFIASLKTNGKIEDHLADMRTEVSASLGDRDVKQRYYNEIMARHSLNLEFNPTPGIDRVLATSSIYLLLSNPSYFLMNATQPWMMSHPMIAGKHGYSRSASALVQGYKDVMPILKDAQFDEKSYAKLPLDVREAIEKLANKGVIQIELGQELGQFKSSPDDATRVLSVALNKLRGAAQGVETLNRLSTAIAAYRLEKQRTGSAEAAIDYAAQVINETHGDYTGFNAPRFMRSGIGRVATQFRKFQLIQISMFARLINRSFKGATQEERIAARYALGYNLAHLGAIGGVAALPGFSAAAWLVGKAFGDDEPDDPRATLTRAVGKDMADLLWGGASQAAGVPIGGRVGAGNMLSPLPYTDIEVSREGYAGILMGMAGPLIGGLMPRAFDGIGMVASGDLWKGAEALAPSGVANISKAVRFQVEGVTQRNGDQAMSPEDISFLDSALQAVGLPTNTIQERTYLAGAKFKADTFYKDRTSSLKKAYSEAFRDNDADAMREVREEWQSTQVTRRELGFTVQPLSELLKAPQEQRKREAGMVGGVGSNKSTEGFLRTLQ